MTSHLILSLTFCAKSVTGREGVRDVLCRWVMVGEECGLVWGEGWPVGWGLG